MKPISTFFFVAALGGALSPTIARAADPLPSWNDTAPKQAITAFVEKVTKEGASDFVPPAERIAVFDNDGTLWGAQCSQGQGMDLAASDQIMGLPQVPSRPVFAGDLQSGLDQADVAEVDFRALGLEPDRAGQHV
jgi:hypothetical protein